MSKYVRVAVKKKPGRKPLEFDPLHYFCPRCQKGGKEKSKHKNLCRPCYNAEYNARTKKWYAEHRSKGYGKRGRPTGPPPSPATFSDLSAVWLSISLTPDPCRP